MKNRIDDLLSEIDTFIAESKESVEEFRIKILSKKGKVTVLFDEFKNIAPELRKEVGQKLNELKNKAQEKVLKAFLNGLEIGYRTEIEEDAA